jgi:hypothetical protein
MSHKKIIIDIIESDGIRMDALILVSSLNLNDWLIAAGFVRNGIWDNVYNVSSEMNDIDVIYFCADDISEERDKTLEFELSEKMPSMNWSVKNQARMHLINGDFPYASTLDAMSFWPERQTGIGVYLNNLKKVTLVSCHDFSIQFNGKISHNPKRSLDVFNDRVSNKGWLKIWPALQIET